jgi:hypothetical protein
VGAAQGVAGAHGQGQQKVYRKEQQHKVGVGHAKVAQVGVGALRLRGDAGRRHAGGGCCVHGGVRRHSFADDAVNHHSFADDAVAVGPAHAATALAAAQWHGGAVLTVDAGRRFSQLEGKGHEMMMMIAA